VTQQLCSILFFSAIFTHLYEGTLHPLSLLSGTSCLLLLAFFTWEAIIYRSLSRKPVSSEAFACFLFLSFPHSFTHTHTHTLSLDLNAHESGYPLHFKGMKAFQGTILFICVLLAFTPILKTLTEDTSSDSIWALSTCLFIVNLLMHDYRHGPSLNLRLISFDIPAFSENILLCELTHSDHAVFCLFVAPARCR
jgi:hypothetical protein